MHAEQTEDLRPHAIITLVGVVTEVHVGIYRVVALLLQLIGGNLRHQADAAPFLVEVEDNALAGFVYHLHGAVQLLAAVAALGTEDVAGHAGGMHAHGDCLVLFPFALNQGNVLEAVVLLAEGDKAEMAVLGGHVHLLAFLYEALVFKAVGNEVFDCDDVKPLALGKFLQLRHTRHGAVVVEYFNEAGGRREPGEAGEVNGCFGVSGAGQHSPILRVERIDVSGASEVLGLAGGVGKGADCGGAVVAAYARGAAFEQVDGYGKGRAEHTGIGLHLMLQFELAATLVGDGSAKHAAPAAQHEVHGLGGGEFGGHNKVALVFAVFIVNHDDEFAGFEIFYCLIDRGETELFHIYIIMYDLFFFNAMEDPRVL